jgi:hypothetical protein
VGLLARIDIGHSDIGCPIGTGAMRVFFDWTAWTTRALTFRRTFFARWGTFLVVRLFRMMPFLGGWFALMERFLFMRVFAFPVEWFFAMVRIFFMKGFFFVAGFTLFEKWLFFPKLGFITGFCSPQIYQVTGQSARYQGNNRQNRDVLAG